MPQVSCERVPPVHFYLHGALVFLEKLIVLVQVPLVMHKHKIPYIIWQIITCAD